MFLLDAKSPVPLYRQLYEALKHDILTHKQAGEKLPSIRKIATLYNISKTTVETAYAQLYAEGYIESRPKSGYVVSEIDTLPHKLTLPPPSPAPSSKHYRYDFFPAQLHPSLFPLKLYKRLSTKALNQPLDLSNYGEGLGDRMLREQIAAYLATSRGVHASPEQIVVTSGFIDAMGLVARLLRNTCTHFGMEHPGYHVARRIFEDHGYTVHPIPVTDKGIDTDALQASPAQVVYITPSHQYPTGVSMPVSRRQKLIEIMASRGGFVIEDDYDSELRYEGNPLPALQGLDRNDCVIYTGTFAKSFSPALRIGYMVLPRPLLARYHKSYDTYFSSVSLHLQRTMALMMQEGHYERHIRKARTFYRKKHNRMRDALQERLGNTMRIVSQGGGLSILIQPTHPFDWEKLQSLAEDAQLKIYLSKERSGGEFEALRVGFGGFEDEEIVEAMEALGEVWFGAII